MFENLLRRNFWRNVTGIKSPKHILTYSFDVMWLCICPVDFKTQLVTLQILSFAHCEAALKSAALSRTFMPCALSRMFVLCALKSAAICRMFVLRALKIKVLQLPGCLCSMHLKVLQIKRIFVLCTLKSAATSRIFAFCALKVLHQKGEPQRHAQEERASERGVSQGGTRPQTCYIATANKQSHKIFPCNRPPTIACQKLCREFESM